jgi:hypothetical protein
MDLPGRTNNLYKEHVLVEDLTDKEPEVVMEPSPACMSTLTAGQGTLGFCTTKHTNVGYVPPRQFQFDLNIENIINRPKWIREIFTPGSYAPILLVILVLLITYHLFRV